MSHEPFAVELTLRSVFEFAADLGVPGVPDLTLDEPPPLGAGRGPNAARILAAAVGNCLGASLLLCLRKSRIDVRELRVSVQGSFSRNERGRLRIASLSVTLHPDVPPEQHDRMARCREVFEDFCIVTGSVREGVDVQVTVDTPAIQGSVP